MNIRKRVGIYHCNRGKETNGTHAPANLINGQLPTQLDTRQDARKSTGFYPYSAVKYGNREGMPNCVDH